MNWNTGVNLRWPVLTLAGALLIATGAGATYFVLRPSPGRDAGHAGSATAPASGAGPSHPMQATKSGWTSTGDVVVSLDPNAVARAGITVATVGAGGAASGLRLPGSVEANAYQQVVVTPLVGGRITRVPVGLGDRVRQGQTMAEVFSPELTDAFTRYTSTRADLEAHERELARTEKLVDIGAASRQELERLHAEHTARRADVRSARSRLELLGAPASALDGPVGQEVGGSVDVPAPRDGVVTERVANVGLNVEPASKLFTVADLTTVWVVAELYETDFSRVRVGSPATITTRAYPDLALQGKVSYIDPQVSPQTRTAKLRVEVRNPMNQLRLGMYADVQVSGVGNDSALMVPRSAVQTIGDRQVVYLADSKQPGTFTEREVRLGPAIGENVEVLSGVRTGDSIVAEGSFFVRAERERLGLRASSAAAPPSSGPSQAEDRR